VTSSGKLFPLARLSLLFHPVSITEGVKVKGHRARCGWFQLFSLSDADGSLTGVAAAAAAAASVRDVN